MWIIDKAILKQRKCVIYTMWINHPSIGRQLFFYIHFDVTIKMVGYALTTSKGLHALVIKAIMKAVIRLTNNFIELLADGGIIGFALYYSIYAFLLIRFIMIRDFRNQQFNICATLLVVNLIIEYGAVTYIYKHTYMFLMMFMLQYEQSKNSRFDLQSWITNLVRTRRFEIEPKERF